MHKLFISGWSCIDKQEAIANAERQQVFASANVLDKLEQLYRSLGVNYPKFFKMDAQSKLGWLCAEYVLKDVILNVAKEDVALILSNQKASLDTDENYWNALEESDEFMPSPAVFVYTLPNIVTGEICIRHGFKGENNFFVSESFDPVQLVRYTQGLFVEELCKAALVGWVEVYKQEYKALFVFVESSTGKENNKKEFTVENLNQLYQNKL